MGQADRFYEALSEVRLRDYYNQWVAGNMTKIQVEREIGDEFSRGQGITRAWRKMGLETAGVDWRDMRIAELEDKVRELEGMLDE